MRKALSVLALCLVVSAGTAMADAKEERMMKDIQRYIDQGDSAKAEKLMRKALKSNPDDWKMWNDLGSLMLAQGDYKGAKKAYDEALVIDEMQAMTYNNLGTLALVQNDVETAFKNLITATEMDSDYVPAQYNLGMYYTRRQRLTSAMNTFEKVLKLDPKHAGALIALARIKRMTGAPEAALVLYERALQADPGFAEGRIEYAMLLFALKDKAAAESMLRDCIRRYPKNPDSYYSLGLFLRDTGKLDEAARSLKQAVLLDGKNPQFRIDYGLVLLYQTKRKDASAGEKQIRKALDLAPEDGKTVYMSAIFYDDAGMLKDAAKLYARASKLDYKPMQAKVYHAEALIKLGEKKAAGKILSELDNELKSDDPLRAQVQKLKGGV